MRFSAERNTLVDADAFAASATLADWEAPHHPRLRPVLHGRLVAEESSAGGASQAFCTYASVRQEWHKWG